MIGHALGYVVVSLIWFALGLTLGRDAWDWWRLRAGGMVRVKRLDHVPANIDFPRCLPGDPSPKPRRRAS